MLELTELMIAMPDNGIQDEGWTWADLTLLLRNAETDEHPSVKVSVHIRCDDDRSVAEAKREARDNALTTLREAVRLLEALP